MRVILLCLGLALAGCAGNGLFQKGGGVEVRAPGSGDIRPKHRPDSDASSIVRRNGGGLNDGGLTVAEATRVSDAEVAAAVAPAAGDERTLGDTVATMGLLGRDGFWLSTPLVKSEIDGRVIYKATGAAANVTLIPNGASAGSGSQISIAAMQALGIPLTELAELKVFSK